MDSNETRKQNDDLQPDKGLASEPGRKQLDPLSRAVQRKKEQWYDHVKLSVRQMMTSIWVTAIALLAVFILMFLESAGLFKLPL